MPFDHAQWLNLFSLDTVPAYMSSNSASAPLSVLLMTVVKAHLLLQGFPVTLAAIVDSLLAAVPQLAHWLPAVGSALEVVSQEDDLSAGLVGFAALSPESLAQVPVLL